MKKQPSNDLSTNDKIRLSKQQLETTFDAIPDFICVIDHDFSIIRVNKSYATFVGKPISQILGKKCFDVLWGRSEACENCPAIKSLQRRERVLGTHVTRKTPAGLRYFDINTYPVLNDDGEPVNVVEYIRDVTEEKHMIEQLIRSEKLASIGTMTTGIAHEMNNALSGISGIVHNMQNMPAKYGLNTKGTERMSAIAACAEQATGIMKDLLHLSGRHESKPVETDINALVRKIVHSSLYLNDMPYITKTCTCDEELPPLPCEPSKIEQVLINILNNAVQAIAEKKQRLFANDDSFEGHLTIRTGQNEQSVIITITDNGTGIDPDVQSRVFDPFFTTKAPGQGTGLGLSICMRIIEEHRGRILCESGDGTTSFSILLPKNPLPAAG